MIRLARPVVAQGAGTGSGCLMRELHVAAAGTPGG
jgi:hypothetical protein